MDGWMDGTTHAVDFKKHAVGLKYKFLQARIVSDTSCCRNIFKIILTV
jgi:hypothetical protein